MNKDIKFYTNQNKEAWDEVIPMHQAASKEKLDLLFSNPSYIYQNDEQLLEILKEVNVKGKDVIQLCCNNGTELLSLKNMGANRCVGVDISVMAITEAQERATRHGIDCQFICSDVYDIPEEYFNSFDIAYFTAGSIGWLPDINKVFEIVFNLLKEKGKVLIHEIHPFSEMLPFDNNDLENRLQIIEPYFRSKAIVENGSLDYVGGTEYVAKTQYWFVHTISSLIMALVNNGLKINFFAEYPKDISAGHKKIEELKEGVPLSYILLGEKF